MFALTLYSIWATLFLFYLAWMLGRARQRYDELSNAVDELIGLDDTESGRDGDGK